MGLRWLRESVVSKPYRPCVERCRQAIGGITGSMGAGLRRLWRALRRLPPTPPLAASAVARIVVIRPDRIGDLVLSTPVLRALRTAYPGARLTLIAAQATQELIPAPSLVDDIIAVPGDRVRDFWHARHALRALRGTQPDLMIALERTWSVAFLSRWLGGQHRVGYDTGGCGWLFTDAVPYPFARCKAHQVEVNVHLLRSIGIPTPPTDALRLEVAIPSSAVQRADAWLTEHRCTARPIVVMHPGSRSRYTQWAPEHFGIVADRLAQEYPVHVLILCGPGEAPIVARMMAAMITRPPVAQELPLATVAALLSRSAVFIGNATGTMHVASAVTPHVIAIIGGTHPEDCPERWGPWGTGHQVVHRTPLEVLGYDTWDWLGQEGLRHITPDDVLRAARQVLMS